MIARYQMNATQRLTAEAVEAFFRDGVLIVENFATNDACDRLRARADALVAERAPAAFDSARTVFSTRDQSHAKNRYFEESAGGIGVFFEEGAFDQTGNLQVPLHRAVNKLGHALHDLDDDFRAFSTDERLQHLSVALGLAQPKVVQSMYIFKQPGIGGEVGLHQDATFLYTDPASTLGFWFALEDTRRDNGCLGGLPGRDLYPLKEIFRRDADGSLGFEKMMTESKWPLEQVEWLDVPKGTMVVFDGRFPHLSEANRSSQSRHAFTLHAVSAAAHYPATNWLQRDETILPYRDFLGQPVPGNT
jgi:phytanoyl-CoA hydroxylase